ncbi:TonB-dependent receptor domain-containing protein [Granulicella tundricola]|uniref:Cna B domain protein n=1 Tax=Granulicella tundricola (strain ATCC BAA-1859 / DSM 23138 / MP5ACTX9) TaxID=1198114 RepID=E8X7I1_GRATM|nr:TonB-dependent receptor [Granulicella tundricola]ADW71415.1 Cna B domain protein [Granulicella tundricola MP5ACTX9]
MRRIPFFVPLITMTLAAGSSFAQTTSGDIAGTVKDASGAVVPHASVTVKNEETGVTVNVTAGNSGDFHASNLLPGKYDLAVSAPGFQPSRLNGVLVELNKTSTSDVSLSIGTSTTVEVVADAGAVIDTTTTNLSQTFSNVELSNLPTTSTGFGVINASLLSPGVASAGGIGIGTGPSVGGQRPRNNNFTIEGIDNNDKAVTGPLIYIPNDSVGSFTLITNQFSPEFGHSSGGQFNTNIVSGTNTFHGKLYEYFQNRDLFAGLGSQASKPALRPRYDNNRYGAQLGGPILHDKLFFFANFERNSIGSNPSLFSCVPTAAGKATLATLTNNGFSATNLQQFLLYTPAANVTGANGAGIDAGADAACGNQASGPQSLTVYSGTALNSATGLYASGTPTVIPLGNYQTTGAAPSDFDVLTTSVDYTITPKDSFRGRYVYNRLTSTDTGAGTVPFEQFYTTAPNRYQLIALSEFHTFTPNLTNELRIGFNRHSNTITAGNFTYPGLDSFPNFYYGDLGQFNLSLGPDSNAPQFTIQNLYQLTDNISYVKGKHDVKIGFDGRKYISPQGFTQRARGDYEYNGLTEFLHDLAPTSFGERSTGNLTYYGDQTALYGYGNDTWRLTPTLTLNYGLRYEFTSVPVGERAQALNANASVPGLVTFQAPKPAYKNFAPRAGINWAPDEKTSVRAAFGIAYDVLFDNLGTLSFPPQYSSTNDVGNVGNPQPGDPNFLKNGGLPAGTGGILTFANTPTGIAAERAATAAFLPNQVTPYAETYTLTVQRTIASNYTMEIGYIGTRGIHLPMQDQINVQPRVTAANQLPTSLTGATTVTAAPGASTLAKIQALSNIVPAWNAAGFTSKITSYQPYSSSNYNAGIVNLTRRMSHGLSANLSYTYSKTMDDATAEVFATTLTPRRPQNSQNIAADYSRSALDRTHRATLAAVYDLQLYKHSNHYLLRNGVGNWTISPIYTYESPEYVTVLSGVNSNLNGDSGNAIDRTIINPNGAASHTTSSTVHAQYAANLAGLCGVGVTQCAANTVGYVADNPTAYYIQAGVGTLPNAPRNSLATRPINNFDVAAYKRINFRERYSFEFGAQAFNVLNHAQYTPGTVNNVNSTSSTGADLPYQTVGNAFFAQPGKVFTNNGRTMQLSGKVNF